MEKTTCELFAGVGGFRLGMERLRSGWRTVWFSQWEPGKKAQWAHDCYVRHFGDCPDANGELHTGEDISGVDKAAIPDFTLLMAGFPCQDYSVAHTLKSSRGIEGKKGVLWWQIRGILETKAPAFCLFENVDRLLKSPARQRGRDFGVMLACLRDLGYRAEWRVVNAASYGAAQRRRRTFIFAYKDDTAYAAQMDAMTPEEVFRDGFMQRAFPASAKGDIMAARLDGDIADISDGFSFPFPAAGYMKDGEIAATDVKEEGVGPMTLGAILEPHADGRYCIPDDKLPKWEYLKGAKKIPRKAANGHEYVFSEGPVAFPDPPERPGRTMLTSESTLNRSTHVVADPATGRLRTLTPVEAERLQGFDDGWTEGTVSGPMPERMRYFCMGNALVVPMVTRMGRVLDAIVAGEP